MKTPKYLKNLRSKAVLAIEKNPTFRQGGASLTFRESHGEEIMDQIKTVNPHEYKSSKNKTGVFR